MARPGFRLALCATLLALMVVGLGAYTRLTHAGLGCPDWPGCYGLIGVPQTMEQMAHAQLHFPEHPVDVEKGRSEMVHRYFAGSLALCIVLLAAQAWRRRTDAAQPLGLPLLLLGLLLAQVAFGMWTVTLRLWPQVVTAHLLGGLGTLSLLFLLSLRLSGQFNALPGLPAPVRLLAALGLCCAVIQVALGGWVSSNYAALSCLDLPTCQGQWWPDADFANGFHLTQHIGPDYLGGRLDSEARTAIHLVHRLGAGVTALVLLTLAAALWRVHLRGLAVWLGMALLMQVSLGMANVLLHLPVAIAVAHNLGAAALLLSLVLVNYRVRAPARLPLPRAQAVPVGLGKPLRYR